MRRYFSLPKQLYALFAGIFLMNLGNYIWPLFAMMSYSHYGLIGTEDAFVLGALSILRIIGSIIGGKLTDHYGRVKTFSRFLILSGIAYIIAGFFSGRVALIPLLIGSFFAAIGSMAGKPLIMDYTETDEQRKISFSLHYIALNAGYAIGPLIGGLLLDHNLIEFLYLGDGITTTLYGLIVVMFVRDLNLKKKADVVRSEEKSYEGSVFGALFSRPIFVILLISMFFNRMAFRFLSYGLPKYVQTVFENSGFVYGVLSSINGIVAVVVTPIILKITKRIDSGNNLLIGYVIYSAAIISSVFIESFFSFIVMMFVFTVGEIILTINSQVFQAKHTPINFRGRFTSVNRVVMQVASFLGVYVMSYLFEYKGYTTGLLVIGVTPLISFILIMYIKRLEQHTVSTTIEV